MFSRVLVANRGEIAVRIIRAVHELGAEAVAVYSTADRDSLHVRLADRSVCIGPPSAAESYLRVANVIAAAETTGCEAIHPGYGFLSENPAFVRACEDTDLVFVGPRRRRDGADGRQGAREGGDEGGRRPARARDRGRRDARGGARRGGGARLPGAPEGDGGWRRQGDAPRSRARCARGGVLDRPCRGRGRVLGRLALPREGARPGPARRDPGALRQGRRRADAGRARVLDPAAPPEADRGVAVAGARRRHAGGDGGRGRAGVPDDRVRERGHVRVPARRRRHLPLHRAERPPPGRAPGQRARHRRRRRPRAAPCGGRRAALAHRPGAAPRARARDPAQRGGSLRATSRPHPGRSRASGRRSGRASGSTRTSRKARRSRPTTTR